MIDEIIREKTFTDVRNKQHTQGPGWLKNASPFEYRNYVHQAMAIAKNRLERRNHRFSGGSAAELNRLNKEYDNLTNGTYKTEFHAENKHSIAENGKRQLFKQSACMKKTLERYFEVNDKEKFAYYGKPDAKKPKKQLDTNKFDVKIEDKLKLNPTERKTWPKKEENAHYRVRILVPKGKKKREVYFYTSDYFEAELVKLEIQKHVFGNLRIPVMTANEIFRANL